MEPLRDDDPRSLGGFRVLALLAVGGMGRVYLALGADRRAVALKVARGEFAGDARFRARFRREVETGRGVGAGGAWIAPIVAADPDAELPWLASEYVPGPSVTEALMGFGPLSPDGLRTLTRGLASALAEVHAANVMHRDVKPSNVLLARDGPRLIDFGVARAVDDVQLTRVGAVIGSPGFLSPEQAVGKPASFGSDVFSMASVVAYAARGVGPFGAGEGPALLYRVVHEPPKLVNVPRDLAEVLAACLVKDPGERPSALEVAAWVREPASAPSWLTEAVLGDIARREAELAAWIEVTGEPLGNLDEADFEVAADSAVELANANVGIAFERAADSALELANTGVQARFSAPSAAEAPVPRANPFERIPAAADSAVRTTHRRAHPRRRFPVFAALGALVGGAAAAVILLLPHGHGAPPPSQSPAILPAPAASVPSAAHSPTQKTAPPATSGRRSGPPGRRGTPTSASGSRR